MIPITAYIALGSNLGDREKNLRLAIDRLCEVSGIDIARVSSFLENPAVGGPAASPAFVNAVAELRTSLSAADLLATLLATEKHFGRVRREKWEPRVLDLDLILYADQIIHSDHLTVPHPLMHERRFVLEPLAEIAPDVIHPALHVSIAALLERLRMRKD